MAHAKAEAREVELTSGEIIAPVTRIATSRLTPHIDNLHTPGGSYRPVDRQTIEAIRPIGEEYE